VGLGVVTVDPDLCHRLVPALNRLCAALAKVATAGEAGACLHRLTQPIWGHGSICDSHVGVVP
jgi:hypothetical protein